MRPTPSSPATRTGAQADARVRPETDPPGIWCMFSDGSTVRFSLDGLPCPGLAVDLLTGLAGLSTRTAASTPRERSRQYVRAFREMARRLSPRPGSPAGPPTCAGRT